MSPDCNLLRVQSVPRVSEVTEWVGSVSLEEYKRPLAKSQQLYPLVLKPLHRRHLRIQCGLQRDAHILQGVECRQCLKVAQHEV